MKPKYHYTTVIEALEELKHNGYVHDFNLRAQDIKSNPHHFEIEHVYRYEGDSDPDEEAVVYGISSNSGEKGVFVSGFSANSEDDTARILRKICIEGSGTCEI
ncbi:MAG: hypothetical protein ACI7YS_08330 [Flavobacterium sp.]